MNEKLLNQETSNQIKELLSELKKKLTIVFFTKENCEHCNITKQLFEEIAPLNDNISLQVYDINNDTKEKQQYNINDAPSYLILNDKNEETRFSFYGIPAGHEINTLLAQIVDIGSDEPLFDDQTLATIKGYNKEVNIKVFVTTACPHCPGAAINASRLAILNPNIKAEIYEASTFNEISNKYQVSGVPKIVINETESLMGNQPINAFLETINKL